MNSYKLIIRGLSKSFDGRKVLDNLNLELSSGSTYCLMGASGIGKTTFLRILLGLEQADSGQIIMQPGSGGNGKTWHAEDADSRLVAVFQEDRLCETFSALENVMLTAGKSLTQEDAFRELCRLLPEESVTRPVSTLSGGMKRRVAILRALLAPSCGILMDEPFTGLDEDTRRTVTDYVREKSAGKLLVVITHQEEDVAALDAIAISFSRSA